LPVAKEGAAGAGTQTAGLAIGGYTTTQVASTEEYDGSSWTAGGNLNTARYSLSAAGIQTAALAFGGYTTALTGATEEYDGISWSSNPTGLNTSRLGLGGAGTQTAALAFSGSYSTSTEEWTGPGAPLTVTITAS